MGIADGCEFIGCGISEWGLFISVLKSFTPTRRVGGIYTQDKLRIELDDCA